MRPPSSELEISPIVFRLPAVRFVTLAFCKMTDRKASKSLQDRIDRLNASRESQSVTRPEALPLGGLSKLRSKFEGTDSVPLVPKGSFGLGAPSTAPGMGSADRNRIASGASPTVQRAASPTASPIASRIASSGAMPLSSQVSDRSASPIPTETVASGTTSSNSARAPSDADFSVPSSPASSIARTAGYPAGIPPRLTHDLLDSPGMRTPQSVSSMNVETGSISSGHNPLDDLSGDSTPPLAGTPSAKAMDDSKLMQDISILSLDANAPSPRSSIDMESPDPGTSTPISTAGSHVEDLLREQQTEQQLEAYENESHERARSPDHAAAPIQSAKEQRIRHVSSSAHETPQVGSACPVTDVDQAEIDAQRPRMEKTHPDGATVTEVPENALAADQLASQISHIHGQQELTGHSKLAVTTDASESTNLTSLAADAVSDADNIEALSAEGGVKLNAESSAALVGRDQTKHVVDPPTGKGPMAKCSDCGAEVTLQDLSHHVCISQSPLPAMTVPMLGHLSAESAKLASTGNYVIRTPFAPPTTEDDLDSVPEDFSVETTATSLARPFDPPDLLAAVPSSDSYATDEKLSEATDKAPRLANQSDNDADQGKGSYDNVIPRLPATARSPTTNRISNVDRRRHDDSSRLHRLQKAEHPQMSRELDESDTEYEGGWARAISSNR